MMERGAAALGDLEGAETSGHFEAHAVTCQTHADDFRAVAMAEQLLRERLTEVPVDRAPHFRAPK